MIAVHVLIVPHHVSRQLRRRRLGHRRPGPADAGSNACARRLRTSSPARQQSAASCAAAEPRAGTVCYACVSKGSGSSDRRWRRTASGSGLSSAPRALDNLLDNAVYRLRGRNSLRTMTFPSACCTSASPAISRRARPSRSPTTEPAFRGAARRISCGRSSRASRTASAESVPCGAGTWWGKPGLSA